MHANVTRRDALRRLTLLTCPAWVPLLGCAGRHDLAPTYWLNWRKERFQDIAGPNGWATLAGLHWLEAGDSTVGTDSTSGIRLPEGTAVPRVGVFTRKEDRVGFTAEPGVEVTLRGRPVDRIELKSDVDGAADALEVGRLKFWVIARGDRRGIRVRDPESPVRLGLKEIPVYRYSEAYRVMARFEPYDPPRKLTIADVTGGSKEEVCPGALVFRLGKQEYRLDALDDTEAGDLLVLFRDGTSGRQTYGGGRFLHARKPMGGGGIELDFNRAYNPPCAFTPYATCPVPPRQNWLEVDIPAGEKDPGLRS